MATGNWSGRDLSFVGIVPFFDILFVHCLWLLKFAIYLFTQEKELLYSERRLDEKYYRLMSDDGVNMSIFADVYIWMFKAYMDWLIIHSKLDF